MGMRRMANSELGIAEEHYSYSKLREVNFFVKKTRRSLCHPEPVEGWRTPQTVFVSEIDFSQPTTHENLSPDEASLQYDNDVCVRI